MGPAAPTSTPKAAIYARQSVSREDTSASCDEQIAWCRDECDRRGLVVAAVYVDQDAPAANLRRRRQWGQLLVDAKSGTFDCVVSFNDKRLFRDLDYQLATFRRLHERGITHVVAGTSMYPTDPKEDPKARLFMQISGAISEHDNAERAAIVQDNMNRERREGRPHGGSRQFGYSVDRSEIIEDEAALIREAYERLVINKEASSRIAQDWNDRGIRTTRGNEWSRRTFIRLMSSPSLAGFRSLGIGADRIEGTWNGILTEQEHHQLVGALQSKRKTRTTRTKQTLLVGFVYCARCHQKVYAGVTSSGKACYKCTSQPHTDNCGRVSAIREPVDDLVSNAVIERLRDNKLIKRHIAAAAAANNDLAQAQATLRDVERQKREIGRMMVDPDPAVRLDAVAARAALESRAPDMGA